MTKKFAQIVSYHLFILLIVLGFNQQSVTAEPDILASIEIAQSAQTFTSHWEGTIFPDISVRAADMLAETLSFDVTYDADSQPAMVNVTASYRPGIVTGTVLECFAGSSLDTDQISINPIFIFPLDPTGWGFAGTKAHPNEGQLAVTSASAIVGPVSGQGLELNRREALVSLGRNYSHPAPGGGTVSEPCNWTGKAVCLTNCIDNVSLSAADYVVREAEGMIDIPVQRVSFDNGTDSVNYTTSNGTATAGQDYTSKSGTLSFGPGEFSKTIQIPIADVMPIEGEETFTIALSNPSTGTVLGANSQATITIDDRPDLTIEPFTLPIDNIQPKGNGYELPDITVTVKNLAEDGETLTNVPVKFTSGSTVIHEEIIAAIGPDSSRTFMFDWDISSLLQASGENIELMLTGTIDPADSVLETNESNNEASSTGAVNLVPTIIAVNPQFTLDGHYFLDNQNVANLITVLVDWNGDLPGNGNAPYGDVLFELNGVAVTKTGTATGATHTYDMGSDFDSSLSCANNTLNIWASNGDIQSDIMTIQPTVFPFPEWVEWVIQNIPGSDATFQTKPKAPLVEYDYEFKYPEPAFEANWDVPGVIPYLGGKKIGILETQAAATALGRSNGIGEVGLSGQTGLGLAAVDIAGEIGGVGEVQFKCGESLDLLSTTLTLNVSAAISREMGLVDLFPPLAAAENWAVVGSVIAWINSTAEVEASITPAIAIETTFVDNVANELVFESGQGTGSVEMGASLSVAPVDGLEASVSGGGTPYVTVQVPAAPGYLKEVGIILDFEAMLEAWFFEASYQTQVNCNSNGGCTVDEDRGPLMSEPKLITRDYDGKTYDIYLAPRRQPNGTTTLIANIYPRPETALAIRADGERLVAAVHDDTSKAAGRGTEIRVLQYSDALSIWTPPVNVTSDSQPDFNPALAFDSDGDGILIWERSALAPSIVPSLDIAFAQSLDIYSSIWNGVSWTAPAALTSNGLMDHAPQLTRGNDETVIAAWQSNDGTDILGTVTHPVTVSTAVWNGASWDATVIALSGQTGVIKSKLAVKSATEAAIVLLKLAGDTELHYAIFNGATWSGLTQITTNALSDEAPQLVYDSAGNRHLVWRQDGKLMWLKNSWDVNDAEMILDGANAGGFLEMRLSADSLGNMALVWPSQAGANPELMSMIYDGTADEWSTAQPLTDSSAAEGAIATAFDPDGTLAVAHRSTARTLATGSNGAQNVPTLGSSDLAFTTHPVGRDLTVESLSVSPLNPAPGTTATVTAVLKNSGDLTVAAPQLAFLDGVTTISTQTLPDLGAGMTTTVTTNWSVPVPPASHTLKATADPNSQVVETDESNNDKTWVTTLPNLEIDVVYTVHSGAGVTVTTRIKNSGVVDAAASVLTLRAGDASTGQLLGTVSIPVIPAGGSHTTSQWVDAGTLAGLSVNRLWAVADSSSTVVELDEADNTAAAPLYILPDLTLSAADVVGGAGVIEVTIHNEGLAASMSIPLWLLIGGNIPTSSSDYVATVPAIPAGGQTVVMIEIPAGSATYGLKVDPGNTLEEMSEGNNATVQKVTVSSGNQQVYLPIVLR